MEVLMTLHIDAGEYVVKQRLTTTLPVVFTEVGRVVVIVSGTTATEHWYLYTGVDTSKYPGGGTYRAPNDVNTTEHFQLAAVVSTSPFDPTTFDDDEYGEGLGEKGISFRYIRARCAAPTSHDGRSRLPGDEERLTPGVPTSVTKEEGQIYLNEVGTYFEVQQGGVMVGYLYVDAATTASGDASVEDWRLYGSYATPLAASGGSYTIIYKIAPLPLGTAYQRITAGCSALPP
jgi:hypothetical protein